MTITIAPTKWVRIGRRTWMSAVALFVHLFLHLPVVHSQSASKNEAEDAVHALVLEGIAKKEFKGIAVGFSAKGREGHYFAAGVADERAERSFTVATPSRVASISKPITAVAIMQQVEEGTVLLDATIQTYLPDLPVNKEGAITVRQLMAHTAGIGGYANVKERENQVHYSSLVDAMAVFQDRDLVSVPGKEFHYSTYGYVILGAVLEKVSGIPFAEYLERFIFRPAGMSDTGIETVGKEYPGRAELYHATGKGRINAAKRTDLSDRVPGGGIYSTVTDLLKFGDAVMNGTLISAESWREMTEGPKVKMEGNDYGLGWYLYGEHPFRGTVVGHNGSQTGATTFLMLLPDHGTTVVVLSNTSGAMEAVTGITMQLMDAAVSATQE